MNILIIGASRGIGKAVAKQLAQDGHRVLITGRNPESLQRAGEEIGSNAEIFQMDLTSREDTCKLVNYMQQSFLPDGIVLSAAKFPDPATKTSVLQPSAEELSEILEANVVANYRIIRELLPVLADRKAARVVIIGSTSGVRQDKGGIYGISKWALRSYAYGLRDECRKYGIGVSLINPGGTFTETRKKQTPDDRSLLESSDFGILVSALFKMSPQAVMERVDIRPLAGDTY